MKYNFTRININSSFPICQAGFQQTTPIFEVHDDLYARIMCLEDDKTRLYLISCDNLGLPIRVQKELETRLNEVIDKKVIVTISCTHSHYAPTPHNVDYQNEVLEKLYVACKELELKEANLTISYQKAFFDKLGKSRISHHDTKNIFVQLLSLYEDDKRVAVFIVHNVHPTTQKYDTAYFSADYPGYVLTRCMEQYPDTAFTFMQGADGDISTRFTRRSQNYAGMCELGDKLFDKIVEMLNEDVKTVPLTNIEYESVILPLEHEFNEIDLSKLPANLATRELETIEVGKKLRKELATKLDTLPKEYLLSRVKLADYKLIFAPNELFSSYIDYIDTTDSILVCYSNGYYSYVTGIDDDFVTYETFTCTLTKETKKRYAAKLSYLSQK